MASISDKLKLFGILAFQKGFATRLQIEECLKVQKLQENKQPLGQILYLKGYITEGQIHTILREQSLQMCICKQCSKTFNYPISDSQPPECPFCGFSKKSGQEEVEEFEEIEEIEELVDSSIMKVSSEPEISQPEEVASVPLSSDALPDAVPIEWDELEEEYDDDEIILEKLPDKENISWNALNQEASKIPNLSGENFDISVKDSLDHDAFSIKEDQEEQPSAKLPDLFNTPDMKNFDFLEEKKEPDEFLELPLVSAPLWEEPKAVDEKMPDSDFFVQKTLGDEEESEIFPVQKQAEENFLEMPMDLDCFKEDLLEPPTQHTIDEKNIRALDPSATFGLMPVGSAIDLEEKNSQNANFVSPIKEIDLGKAGIEDLFLSEPTAQTQEWNFDSLPSDLPFNNEPPKKASHEMDSGFFNSLEADKESADLPFALTVKPGSPEAELPAISNTDQTLDGASFKKMIPFSFGADDPTAIDSNDFVSKKSPLLDLKPFREFPKESEVPATSNLSGIPGIQNLENLDAFPAKESSRQESKAGKRPKIQRRSRLAQVSGKRRVASSRSDSKMIWVLFLVAFLVLVVVLVLYFSKTSSLSTASTLQKAETDKIAQETKFSESQKEENKKKKWNFLALS